MTYTEAKNACFDKLYSFLNNEQRKAVQTVSGPLLILAGAGSGKTTVLVNRIANIIRFGTLSETTDGSEEEAYELEKLLELPENELASALEKHAKEPCPAWAVMCITFTNKAASEMKERLAKVIGSASEEIWAGTFHNICMRILRRFNVNARLAKGFTIYDTDDTKRLITAILRDLNIDEHILNAKSAMNKISRAKESLLTPEEYIRINTADMRSKYVGRVYAEYQKRLCDADAVDFDDIIMKTVNLLRDDEEVRNFCQRRFKYVCVDEFQDTNKAQFELTALISGKYRNLMAVGDDDQSIYRFRGATVENILTFDSSFPDAKIIKLERNYRSTKVILDAANAVIANNSKRKGKNLWTDREDDEKITVKQASNQNEEAKFIVNTILKGTEYNGKKFSDYAILYRINAMSSSLESVFAKSGIPYRILGGTRFYERKEIKDVIAYLCVIANKADDLRLKRIINEPKRKIGATTIEAIEQLARMEAVPMFDIMSRCSRYTALARSCSKQLDFVRVIASLTEKAKTCSVSSLIEAVLEETGYMAMLEAAGITEIDRVENVKELVSNAVAYEESSDEPSLIGFLEEVALISDVDNYDADSDAVVMMTIHSAKGLEFPYVFLPGMEEGMFPSIQSFTDPNELEEERRLAYVAITRARNKLCCTYARERLIYGKTQYNRLSRFIEEMPDALLDKQLLNTETRSYASPTQQFRKSAIESFRQNTKSSVSKPKAVPIPTEIFNSGEIVSHPTFGDGTVLSVKKMGADLLYEIAFDTVGTKKMMGSYAKLTKK